MAAAHLIPNHEGMKTRVNTMDWSHTAIGVQETWPVALRMQVDFLLANRFPMVLFWEPDFISIYNDAYLPMLGEALLAGLIIGFGVTVCLLRFYGTLPTSSPILKALLLSLVALIVATILVEIPPRLLTATNTPPRYVLIAAAFNTLRFLALGLAIGYLHGRTQKTDPEKPST